MKKRALGPHSVLLFARFSYAHVGPGRDDFERIDNSSDIAQHAVGEITCIKAPVSLRGTLARLRS
mgnify:CR=1 FL=1